MGWVAHGLGSGQAKIPGLSKEPCGQQAGCHEARGKQWQGLTTEDKKTGRQDVVTSCKYLLQRNRDGDQLEEALTGRLRLLDHSINDGRTLSLLCDPGLLLIGPFSF